MRGRLKQRSKVAHARTTRRPARPPRYDELPEIVTVDEMAAFLRIGRNQAYELVKSGRVPSGRFGRIIRVDKAALRDVMKGGV
jgi:excisionase family DNA binding protein